MPKVQQDRIICNEREVRPANPGQNPAGRWNEQGWQDISGRHGAINEVEIGAIAPDTVIPGPKVRACAATPADDCALRGNHA